MLEFYVRHEMIVDKIHEFISYKESKWLEKYISFNKKNVLELKLIMRKTSLIYLLMLLLVNFWKMFGIDWD